MFFIKKIKLILLRAGFGKRTQQKNITALNQVSKYHEEK